MYPFRSRKFSCSFHGFEALLVNISTMKCQRDPHVTKWCFRRNLLCQSKQGSLEICTAAYSFCTVLSKKLALQFRFMICLDSCAELWFSFHVQALFWRSSKPTNFYCQLGSTRPEKHTTAHIARNIGELLT